MIHKKEEKKEKKKGTEVIVSEKNALHAIVKLGGFMWRDEEKMLVLCYVIHPFPYLAQVPLC